MKERDATIDLLRFLGISLIILAHVTPPEYILQLRTFDVPMMFFVSGLAYSGRKADYSLSFFIHRIKRLIIPVYIFITCYYLLAWLFHLLTSKSINFSINDITSSYMLLGGIGYLWIIRVFLLVGILIPILINIEERIKKNNILFFLTILWILLFGLLIETGKGLHNTFIREYLYYAAGYSILFLWGLRIKKSSAKTQKNILISTFGLLIITIITIIIINHWHKLAINAYKYPPRHYFVIYGILMSVFCYIVVKKANIHTIPKIISFIGSNTIWIYFYHIPIINFYEGLHVGWLYRYVILYTSSALLCYLQVSIADKMMAKNNHLSFLKYFKG